MAIGEALYSSRSEEYSTPKKIFDPLNEEFNFTLDPCATAENAKCKKFYTKEQDGLSVNWYHDRVFMNPPYGRGIKDWMHKARISGTLVACLIHSRTDTRWWHEEVEPFAHEIRFLKGRIRFEGTKSSSPFPSVLVIYRPQPNYNEGNSWRKLKT